MVRTAVKPAAAPKLPSKRRYKGPSDLTDVQWGLIEPLVPTPQGEWPSGDAVAAPDRELGP